jgi:CHAT domain-containing protein/cytochrome c-type biogenesis protein CcmH/NrfG
LIQPQDKHLDDVEIDAFVSSPDLEPDAEKAPRPILQRVRQHIESCEACKRKVLVHQAVQKEMGQSGSRREMPPGPDCEIDTNWIEVVAGLLTESSTTALINHASQCGYCGQRLRKAAETLSDEATLAEMEILSQLQSAQPGWPRQMVRIMKKQGQLEQPSEGWRANFRLPKLVFAAAAFAALALVGWLSFIIFRPVPVEQLLAQAYAEKRMLDLRIPGAKNSKIQVERGSEKPPSSLRKAEVLIDENLKKNPTDSKWRQAEGRAYLLEGNGDEAVKSFEQARETAPDSPFLMADLGSALYLRNIGRDRELAYDWLSRALVKIPDDPIILFNRAIVGERINMLEQAKADWEHFLQVESGGLWAEEARERLKKVQEKLERQKGARSQRLLTPAELEAQPNSPLVQEIVDARIEEYLHDAILEWLPRAYPADLRQSPDTAARAALTILSRITHTNHRDAWLEDLLANSHEQNFGAAVKALAAALAANDRGAYDEALRQSPDAEKLFKKQDNWAGVLQAQFQELFALQFIRNGKRCAEVAPETSKNVLRTPYTWLQAQVLLEESACLTTNTDIGQARSKVGQSLAIAQDNAYGESVLRCLNFSAATAAQVGDMKVASSQILEGLNAFWAGNYPALRGYSLYTSLAFLAERSSYPYLQVAAWSQAVFLIDSDDDLLQRGMAHFYLAQAAMDANLLEISEREYPESARLLGLAPSTKARNADRAEVQLAKAKLEIRHGHLPQAQDRLKAILGDIQGSGNSYRAADFYATLGGLELQLGAIDDADRHLRSGLLVTEHMRGTLRTEKERLEWERKASSIYRAFIEEKLRQGDPTNALEIWEWYVGSAIRERERTALVSPAKWLFNRAPAEEFEIPILTKVTTNLPRITRQTVLSYALLTDGMVIWAFDNRGISYAYVQRDPQEIERLARHFSELCADPTSSLEIVQKYGRELYNILITPIAARLEADRGLIIEADGALSQVPFEALVDSTLHYLGEQRTVVSSLGLYYALSLRQLRPITPSDIGLVVAVPSPKGFTPLPDLETETDLVARRFSRPVVLRKNEATLKAVLRALPSAAVFYFAGHAEARPDRTGLLMADVDSQSGDPRLLTAELLKPGSLKHLQIAVLAACDTSKGDEGTYSDMTSLVRTLVRAGVPSIVASRWKLVSGAPDRIALPFAFPQKLFQTSGHPYYWASLDQFGGLDVIPQ